MLYKRLSQTVFIGSVDDCRSIIRKHHPEYANTCMCDTVGTVIPPTVQKIFTPVPYFFQRNGPRYPLIGFPDTYDSVCGKPV